MCNKVINWYYLIPKLCLSLTLWRHWLFHFSLFFFFFFLFFFFFFFFLQLVVTNNMIPYHFCETSTCSSKWLLLSVSQASLDGSVGCWWSGGCKFDPCWISNILSWRLIVKYFLWSFSPFQWLKKGSCQCLANECTQYWVDWAIKPQHKQNPF